MPSHTSYSLMESEDHLTIVINSDIIYNEHCISKTSLDKILDEDSEEIEPGFSQAIFDLLGRSWVSKELLYDVASYIQKQFPENNINWLNTFIDVESYFDRQENKPKVSNDSQNTIQASVHKFKNSIEQQIKLWSQPGYAAMFNERVLQNLKAHNLN